MAQMLYDPSVYDGIPSLHDAGIMFDLKNGEDLVSDKFRNLFLQHSVDRVFGLSPLHRHFDLSPKELLVEYHGTSVPWEETLGQTSPYIRPSNWALAKDGGFRPFEFSYSMKDNAGEDADEPANLKYLEFIRAFKQLLHEEDVEGVFGLCKYPGDDFQGRVEITEGRANINLHPDDYPKDMNSRTAAWFFSPQLWARCTCICAQDASGHSGQHKGHVSTR